VKEQLHAGTTSRTKRPPPNPIPEGDDMKISVEKNVVEFVPESDQEKKQLGKLWNTVVDCVKFNKKLVPIGEFIPQTSELARFAVEE
jgi:hypothetical protein